MLNYLKVKDIKLQNFIDSTKDFLYKKFGVTDRTYSYSNPLGQLLLVVKNISRVHLFYIKDASNQMNFRTANRIHTVQGLAQLQGYNAHRGNSSRTNVKLEMKSDYNKTQVQGSNIFIPNNLKITCINDSKPYILRINKELDKINIDNINNLEYLLVQGEQKNIEFSSDGRNLQTYTIPVQPNEMIEDDFIQIEVNGKKYNRYESMRDVLFMDRFVMVKTGLIGGIDIIFGKDTSHTIPKKGELISISYLTHGGKSANIQNPKFKFVDSAFDELGNEINLNEMFTILSTDGMTYMGSDPEDMELTKLIAPNIVPNAIIHDKKSLIYYIQKMNLFSNVKIVKNNNTLSAILYPRIKDKIFGDNDYFSMDTDLFLLSNIEKKRLLEVLLDKQSNSIEIEILNPRLVKFGVNIILEVFKSSKMREEDFVSKTRESLNEYMLSLKRLNKIPDSDITRVLDVIEGVDTVKIDFIVQKEEHLDSLGNILLLDDEIAVMRGGFTDINGNFVEDSFDNDSSYSSVNVSVRWV